MPLADIPAKEGDIRFGIQQGRHSLVPSGGTGLRRSGEAMLIVRLNKVKEVHTSEGIIRPLFFSEELHMVHLKIPAGLREDPHPHHVPENIVVLKGSVRLNGEMPAVLQEGDLAHIPAECIVGLESEGEAEALLISSPPHTRNRGESHHPIVHYTTPEHSMQVCTLHVCDTR